MKTEKKNIIDVRMFGNLSITYNGRQLMESRSSETQFNYLMQLLLYFREQGVTRAQLRDVLFEDREIEDVQHSMRNIIYNAKKRLSANGLPAVNYIEYSSGVYRFTDEIPVVSDTDRMRELSRQAALEPDPERKLGYLLDACRVYTGSFLKMQSGILWVSEEQRRWRAVFRQCAEEAAEILRMKKDYTELSRLGEYASKVDPFSDWESLQIESLSAAGRYEQAQDLFDRTAEAYILEHGIRSREYLRELSNRLCARMYHQYEEIEDIQGELNDPEDPAKGGYLCSLPVFQGIYRTVERTMERHSDMVFLMLCTIVDSKGNPMAEGSMLDELSDRLCNAVTRSVRHSDTVARYGKGQYLVLLLHTPRENCPIIQKRINQNFLIGRQRTGVKYHVNSVILTSL